MLGKKYSKEFLALCQSVTAKRPRTVITHILEHGQITTEELKNLYGYNHPPRAARDVKEHGIPIERVTVTGGDGRKIAAYRFGDPTNLKVRCFDGRTGLSKQIKEALIAKYGCRCCIYLEEMPENHSHIAMQQLRRVDLQGAETKQYEQLKVDAAAAGLEIPDFVKAVLRKALGG